MEVQASTDDTEIGYLTSSVGSVITGRKILELPLAGRNAYDLIRTQAGVTGANGGQIFNGARVGDGCSERWPDPMDRNRARPTSPSIDVIALDEVGYVPLPRSAPDVVALSDTSRGDQPPVIPQIVVEAAPELGFVEAPRRSRGNLFVSYASGRKLFGNAGRC